MYSNTRFTKSGWVFLTCLIIVFTLAWLRQILTFADSLVDITLLNEQQAQYDDLHIRGDYGFSVYNDYPNHRSTFSILDISNPLEPSALGNLILNAAWISDYDVIGSLVYFATNVGLRIADISDPENPVIVQLYDAQTIGENIALNGNLLYLMSSGSYSPAIHILDITDLASPEWVSTLFLDTSYYYILANDAIYFQDHLYIGYSVQPTLCCRAGELVVVNVSDPEHPVLQGQLPTGIPASLTIRDVGANRYVFLGLMPWTITNTSGGLLIVDVTDSSHMVVVGRYEDENADYVMGASDLVLQEPYAYLSWSDGLRILDVSDLANPVEAGGYAFHERMGGSLILKDQFILLTTLSGSGSYLDTLTANYLATGRVADLNDTPIEGVVIQANNGQSTLTGSDGRFELGFELGSSTTTITPVLDGFVFLPSDNTFTPPPAPKDLKILILAEPISLTLTADAESVITTTDIQGLATELRFPAGAVNEPTLVWLTPTILSNLNGFDLAGHAFEVSVFQNEQPIPDFFFNLPVEITIYYSPIDVQVVSDESQLILFLETESARIDAAQTCADPAPYQRDLENRTLQLAVCQSGLFGLYGPTNQVYLPITIH